VPTSFKLPTLLTLAIALPLALPSLASANMLSQDISNLKVFSFADQEWKLDHHEKQSMRFDCTNCEQSVIVNIQLTKREHFGTLGIEKAKKAKANCLISKSDTLQCDTIIGTQDGDIAGLQSTIKVLDNLYIASYILGDEKTLMQIRTKAETKPYAAQVNNDFFKAIKSEIIKP